jgi:pilus assembly protein Flp/PilA
MNDTMLKMYIKMQNLMSTLGQEEGQDLVEYALVVAIIALGATAAMGTLATDINNAFTGIGTTLNGAM